MDLFETVSRNLLTPAVLFFTLGLLAAVFRSDLSFPEPFYNALTIYLLIAIGLKGGAEMAEAGFARVWLPGLSAMVLGTAIPLWVYPLARRLGGMSAVDSAAIAAHYGSVSAVTFIAATNYLKAIQVPFESYSTAFLAVMESPAILVGVMLGKLAGGRKQETSGSLKKVFHEALFGRSIFLLVGALAIGAVCGRKGMTHVEPFFVTPFQGVLALFLLEMGMVAGRRLGDLRAVGPFLLGFGMIMPLAHGALGAFVGTWSGLSVGGATLFGTLAASASYIAAPAAIRISLPEANPTLYLTSAIAITFPFNIVAGIPIYYEIARRIGS